MSLNLLECPDRNREPPATISAVGILERAAFLEQLDGLLGEASRRVGHLVLLKGEAGIGKSTLIEAFTLDRSARVLWGTCDPVTPPRPLAPIVDIAETTGGDLRSALATRDRHRILSAFLSRLRAEGGPWIVVLEDMQWADEGTLELLRVVGRRIAQLPALVVITYRDDDLGPDHPLSVALGDIPPASRVPISLPPLSIAAVEELAAGTATDAGALHRATGGNPFFVTEVLATESADVPTTVRDAVRARARTLTDTGQRVLRAAAVLGLRFDNRTLSMVAGTPSVLVEECAVRGFLRRHRSTMEFRHELVQKALLESVAFSERADLHGRALAVLRRQEPAVDPAELARHAIGAGDGTAIAELAPQAGARAAAYGAHRAAIAHYESALPHLADLDPAERSSLLAAYAHECYLTDEIERAIAAQLEAIGGWRSVGDVAAQSRALSQLAEYLWWNGEPDRAQQTAADAVRLLESIPATDNMARAYARLAHVSMLSGGCEEAIEWGTRAILLARSEGQEDVMIHAFNTVGCAEVRTGRDEGWEKLEESLRRATVADLEEDTARALNNLMASAREDRRYALFDRYSAEAATFFADRDLDASEQCLIGDVVDGLFERGRWSEAVAQAKTVIQRGSIHGRIQCLTVTGRVAARRGESDPFAQLDEALTLLQVYGGEASYPLRAARAEAAWLAGRPREAAAELESGLTTVDQASNPWFIGEYALWARKLGIEWEWPGQVAEPYALHLAGHPEKAAAAWAALGCPYEEARALAESDDVDDVGRALSIFQSLGASPAAKAVGDRLRALGVRRIGRGPRLTTRANPAGLSNREVEVLTLLADGLRNADIARRLVVSTRTVDHHVSSILNKLAVGSRFEAGQQAVALGLKAE
jgi:DNA-binding CsgD family transcriptional regulator/tetratricopeptide (TPR) repeat protein